MSTSSFTSLKDSLAQVITSSSKETSHKTPLFSHFLKWDQVGDERTKNHTDGVFYLEEDGVRTLIVYTDSPTWAQEFTLDKSLFLTRVEVMFGDTWIDNLRFVVSTHVSKKKNNQQTNVLYDQAFVCDTSQVTLSEHEIQEINSLVQSVSDEKLQGAIKKALIASVKWQKAQTQD